MAEALPVTILQAREYTEWFARLRDINARTRILARIRRLALGNPGDVKAVGEGVRELRIDYGPGYRIYFARRGSTIVVLLCAGDKSRQSADIALALKLAHDWRADDGP